MMKTTILAVILIVAAGAANAQHFPGLAGDAGRMPDTMSPGIQPPFEPTPSMPAPTPAPSMEQYPGSYSQSPSESYEMRESPRGGSDAWSSGASEYSGGMGNSEGGMSAYGRR